MIQMDAIEAAAVLALARQGDTDAFRALVEHHSQAAFRLAYRMTGNEQDAEDVVQDSFLRAYRHLGRFEERASFSTWFHRIVANCALDMLAARKAKRERLVSEGLDAADSVPARRADGPERSAEDSEIARCVAAALEALTPQERAAFTLRHYEGRSIQEISAALGLGIGATKQSVFRAVKKLRVSLAPLRGQDIPL
jgi:RNA polymerase sigma-70 factor, ECF subfamily